MQITFADGTRIEVQEAALDDFVLHDLKWVEFVHGRASEDLNSRRRALQAGSVISSSVKRCPQASARGC
jgi:hypothetical protein